MKIPIPILLVAMLATASAPHALRGEDNVHDALAAAGIHGGLVLVLGCDDADIAVSLRHNERRLVHVLAPTRESADALRQQCLRDGFYGPVSVDLLPAERLPYTDDLATAAIIVRDRPGLLKETMRVLAPGGRALILAEDGTVADTVRKPRPDSIDQWTHFLHGPGNNAVARDRVVGPPQRLRWLADPVHLRSHEHLNSLSALVSAAGRIFYIVDEGSVSSIAAPPAWKLVARDAFNGVLLWKQDLGPWEGHFRLFRSGPAEIGRRLVAVGDEVYVTQGYGKSVSAYDAATGAPLRRYDGTAGAIEILARDERLFVVCGDIDLEPPADSAKRHYPPPAAVNKRIVCVNAATGAMLWRRSDKDTATTMPTAVAVDDGKLVLQNTRQIICLDATDGNELWRADRPVYTHRLSWSAPTLVLVDGVVLSADGSTGGIQDAPRGGKDVSYVLSDRDIRKHPAGEIIAFDAANGTRLWEAPSLQGFCNPGDVFAIDGKVWAGADVASKQALLNTVRDLRTGKILHRRPANGMPVGGHTRCYRNKATERYLILGDIGVEFMELADWSWNANNWVRGTCQYGVMPCNGLLYVPPDSCACRPEMRLHGFSAMAPTGREELPAAPGPAVEHGPAYGTVALTESTDPWPTYRCDATRSGRTDAALPTALHPAWRTHIGTRITTLTVGRGKIFAADVATHTLYALAANNGTVVWRRTLGAAVDSPPTVFGQTVIAGCRDGYVYCLRADDGAVVWRFRAGPRDERLVAMQSVESVWPLHGSVLVHEGRVWVSAGRSPYLDGGVRVIAIDAETGQHVVTTRVDARGPAGFFDSRPDRRPEATRPMLPDILSTQDGVIYMRWMGFDVDGRITKAVKPHLFSATGFLDDTWWHRTYWQYGTWMRGGFGGWPQAARRVPAARIMCVGDTMLYGFGRRQYDAGNGGNVHAGHVGMVKRDYQDMGRIDPPQNPYLLYATPRDPAAKPAGNTKRGPGPAYAWRVPIPVLARGMVLAADTLFLAGPRLAADNTGLEDVVGRAEGVLVAVSAQDGKVLNRLNLAATPVFDGLIATPGALLLAGTDGQVHCFSSRGR